MTAYNKLKVLNSHPIIKHKKIDIMNKLINNIDMCILFSQNFNIDYFLIKFYGITKISVKDQYYIDKINLLRNDFTQFWISLDNDNKNKFIQLVINHAKDKNKDKNLHKINYIDKLCLQCENNKQYLIFIKNRSNNIYNNRCNNNNNDSDDSDSDNDNNSDDSDSDDNSDNSDNNNTKL